MIFLDNICIITHDSRQIFGTENDVTIYLTYNKYAFKIMKSEIKWHH